MARIRTIKPEMWTDERLTECSVSARLLFIGMLNFADDNGNMRNSPKRLKMQVFPADSIETAPLLGELLAQGVVVEYSVDGESYLHIKGFRKHQVINRPSKTDIPQPSLIEQAPQKPVDSIDQEDDSLNAHGVLSDGREGKGKEGNTEEANASLSIAAANDETDRTTPPCPHGELLAIFAEQLPTLPQPRAEAWTGTRAKSLSCRWKWVLTAKKPSGQRYATTKAEGLDFFRRFFGYVATCPHLVGENNRGWMADLGWLANETNFSKVIDGNYDRKELETA